MRVRILVLLLLAGRAEAQLDPSGAWRTLHTAHFRIHFRPAYRDVALTEAREAERAYVLLASELHPPRGKVDLTLADDGDVANGLTSVFPSPRIDLFLTPPATDPGLQLYDSWLRLLTTHELTHVFHLDRARSFWGLAQRVFGRVPGLFPNEYQPSWVTEGLAVYYESKFTNGGRVRGSFHTQILAADHTGGASRRPADALLYTRWADGLVPYAYGSRFFHYFTGVAGDSVVPRFVEATAGQLIPYRVGRQIGRAAPGRSLGVEWPHATRPAPAPGDGAPPPARVIDSLLRTEPVPQVSPDGRRVAYVWDDGRGTRELRVLDAASFRLVAAHAVNAGVSYDWLGDTLIVAQLDFTTRWRVRSDLYRWIPGGAWRRETHGARVVAPRAGGGRLSTIILGPATNHPALPVPPGPPGPPGATWGEVVPSPDGRQVAATRNAGGHWQLVRWPADSPAAAVVLVESRGVITDPTWAAGSELWFVADPTGLPQVYRWRASGGGWAEPLTAEPLGARAPAALGDGTLLYAALTARGWELRRAPVLAGAAPAAFPEPLPFEPAPAVPVRETGYALWPSLRPHFWVPFFLDARPAGRFFGAVTAGTDALGRFIYAGDLLVAPRPFRAVGDFVLVSEVLGNPTLDLSGSSSWHNVAPPPSAPTLAIAELDQDAALGASFVTRRWRTAASVRFAAELERTRFVTSPDTSLAAVCPGCDAQDLIGGSVTLALSRLVAGALSVSPENGFTWSATYRRREEQGGPRWSNEVRSRLGLYARLPGFGGFAHHVLALRLAAGATGGPLGGLLNVGGVSSAPLGLTYGQVIGGTRAFPVRGYRSGALSGARVATGSLEYRLPLALVGRSLGHLPFGADKLWLNAFADAGDAWNRGAAPRLTRLRSTGLELAGDFAVNYDLLLQLRLGVAQPLATPPSGDPRRPRVYVALASDF
ncbi:MAG TPA: LpqB family beta-propeller domain-containing protein [Gemmatimonadales bacterium]